MEMNSSTSDDEDELQLFTNRSEIVIKGYEENENAGRLIVFLVILFVFLVVCLSILISIIFNSYMISKEKRMYRKYDKVSAFKIKFSDFFSEFHVIIIFI